MPLDRVLAIAGIIIGIPGVIVLFAAANETLAAFAGLLAALLLGAAFYIRYLFNAPPYTFPEVNATLEFSGDERRAVLRKIYKIRPNYSHLRQLEHRNISADGQISNFLWNGKPIPSSSISQQMGQYEVLVNLPVIPGRWQIFDGELSYEMKNSFNGNPESVQYCVDFPTKKVVLTILFPKNRPCLSAEARKMQGAGARPIEMPTISQNGRELALTIKRPTYGATYTIYWHW